MEQVGKKALEEVNGELIEAREELRVTKLALGECEAELKQAVELINKYANEFPEVVVFLEKQKVVL